MALIRVVSGGQTGVDVGALRAARAAGLPTGGWAPRGWATEEGPAPWLGTEFGLKECPLSGYPARTRANVEDSDGTLILYHAAITGGTKLTRDYAESKGRPVLCVDICFGLEHWAPLVARWLQCYGVETLNVAGPRASGSPAIEAATTRFLGAVFALLKPRIEAAQ